MSRVPSFRRGRGRRRALLAGAVLAVIGLSGVVAQAGSERALAAEDEAEPESSAELFVAPTTPVFDPASDRFDFEVLVRNSTEEALPAGIVSLSIGSAPLDSTDALGSVDASSTDGRPEPVELTTAQVAATAAGEDQLIEVTVSRDEVPLLLLRPDGVYEVTAEFTVAGTDRAADAVDAESVPRATGSVVWGSAATEAAVPVTLVVPLVLPSSISTLPTRDELAELAPTLLQLFDAAEKHAATVAVDPRILAATRSLGTAAPEAAVMLVDRLEQTGADVFLLQFADADPAAQAALGIDALLEPLGFSYATSRGTFEPFDENQSDATSDPELVESDFADGADDTGDTGTAGQVPTAEELLALPNATPGSWPAEGEVDSATLSLLQSAGLNGIVLDSTNVTKATGTRANLAGFDALISDAALGSAARSAIGGATSTERAAGAAELASRLALAAEAGSTGVVLALDRGALAESADPRSIIAALDTYTWTETVAATAQLAGTAQLRAAATTEDRRELLRTTMIRSTQIDALAPLLTRPDYLTEYQRERLMESFATRYAAEGVDFADVDEATKEEDERLLQGVRPVTSENTQLVGASSRIPVTLRNALPFEASVAVHVTPISAAISLSERDFTTVVPADGNAAVLVPVHSRVSSGESGLGLEIRDESGEQLFATDTQHLTLRTTVELIMVIVLSCGAALLFGFGIWRSIKRKRSGNPAVAE